MQTYKKLRILAIATLVVATGSACRPSVDLQTQSSYQLEKTTALSRVATEYAEVGQPEQAAHLLTQALQTANSIKTTDLKSLALPEVAVGYAEVGQYNQALQIVAPLQTDINGSSALYRIIATAIKAGDFDQALQLSKTLGNNEITFEDGSQQTKAKTLVAIANKATQTEPKDQAAPILAQVLQQSETLPSNVQRSQVLANIAVNYAAVGEQTKAMELLERSLQISQEGDTVTKTHTLAEIAVGYGKVGQQAKALQLLEQARQNANSFPPEVSAPTLAEVAVNYAVVGQQAKAVELLERSLQNAKTIKSRDTKFNALNEVAVQYGEIGQYEQALEVVKLIDQWYPPTNPNQLGGGFRDALTEVAINYAEAGQNDTALQLAQDIRYKSNRANALTRIAVAYAQAGQYDQSFEIVKSLGGESFSGLATDSRQADTLAEIADQATQTESKETALQVLDQALPIAQSIERQEDKIGALAAIASQYNVAGQPNQGLKLLNQAHRLAETVGR